MTHRNSMVILGLLAALFIVLFTLIPDMQDEAPEEEPAGWQPSPWVVQYQTRQIPLEDPRRHLIAASHHHPELALEKLMSAEQVSRMRFLKANTPLDVEAAWMLIQGCEELNIPLWMVLALIDIETGGTFQEDLVGSHRDRGYMQITPITERHLFQRHGSRWRFDYNPEDIFQPWYNLNLGIRYLRELADSQEEVNWTRVLSQYNYGPEGLDRFHNRTGTYETGYSRRVMEKKQEWEKTYHQNKTPKMQD